MPLEFVTSSKGNPQLFYNGYIYQKERKSHPKTIWRCVEYSRTVESIGKGLRLTSKCPGRVHTVADNIVYEHEHNHLQRWEEAAVKTTMQNIKIQARTTTNSPKDIVETATADMGAAVHAQLPPITVIKRQIRRARQKVTVVTLPMPCSLHELVIPQEYQVTGDMDPFLLFDSGPGQDRILMFGTDGSIQRMATSRWYADGTFKSAPLLFQQVFTLHAVNFGTIIPSVFFLLPDKQQRTYERALECLKERVAGLAPISVMTDFEQTQISAFRHCFPGVTNRGCFLFFSQCLWREIQRHVEIRVLYQDTVDRNFALNVRKLAALAFLPEDDVVRGYDALLDSDFFLQNREILSPLTNYFEDTWIGRENRRAPNGRQPPVYALSRWNCYKGALLDLTKMNKAIEGWHRSFSALIGTENPSLWKFIANLKKEYALNEQKFAKLMSDTVPESGQKRYKDTAARIKRVVSEYNAGENFDFVKYLTEIAHNFELQA